MKRAVIVVLVVAAAGVASFAAGAWSASPPSPLEKRLIKNVAKLEAVDRQMAASIRTLRANDKVLGSAVQSLQKSVTTLQNDVKTLKTNQSDLAGGVTLSLVYAACGAALTADAVQGTWQIEDQLSAATQGGKTYYGPQTPVDDSIGNGTIRACDALRITRSQALPPTTGNLAALLLVLRGSAAHFVK